MSDEGFERRPLLSSSASLDEHLAQRALPPGLSPVPYSQTTLNLSAEARLADRRSTRSLSALDKLSDGDVLDMFDRKLQVLLGLLYEFEDWMASNQQMTTGTRVELARRLEGIRILPSALERVSADIPDKMGDIYSDYFKEKFYKAYNLLVRRGDSRMQSWEDLPPGKPLERIPSKLPNTKLDLTQLDRFSRSIEDWKEMRVDGPNVEKCLTANVHLQKQLLNFLIDTADLRYVDASREIRDKLWK